jgi:hypothetical protein
MCPVNGCSLPAAVEHEHVAPFGYPPVAGACIDDPHAMEDEAAGVTRRTIRPVGYYAEANQAVADVGRLADFLIDHAPDRVKRDQTAVQIAIQLLREALLDERTDDGFPEMFNSPAADDVHPLEANLRNWWMRTAAEDIEPMLGKLGEYGSADLKLMGVAMQCLAAAPAQEITLEEGIERAIAFYELGKVARLFGAFEIGITPSPDTLHDGTVYSMMLRRVRETGNWP